MADPIESFLAAYSSDVQTFSQHLRTLVKSALPDAHEILDTGQNYISYAFTGTSTDRIVFIEPMKNHVRLGFVRGSQLPDPNRLLIGEGKWLRHTKVRTLREADRPALLYLLFAANNHAKEQMSHNT